MPELQRVIYGVADSLQTVTPGMVALCVLVILGCCYVIYDAYSDS